MEGSLLSNRSQICFSKHSLLNFRSQTSKGWRTCCSPKSYNFYLLCLPCLVLFKIANMISMSQRALPKVTSQLYISSQRYVPNNVMLKNLHFMTGVSLRLGDGNDEVEACNRQQLRSENKGNFFLHLEYCSLFPTR